MLMLVGLYVCVCVVCVCGVCGICVCVCVCVVCVCVCGVCVVCVCVVCVCSVVCVCVCGVCVCGVCVWCVCVCSVLSDSLQPHGLYPPASSVHGIFQAGVLQRVATALSVNVLNSIPKKTQTKNKQNQRPVKVAAISSSPTWLPT